MKFLKVMLWIFVFPVMLMWVLFKGLIGLSNDMEKTRRKNSRHSGVMSSSRRR